MNRKIDEIFNNLTDADFSELLDQPEVKHVFRMADRCYAAGFEAGEAGLPALPDSVTYAHGEPGNASYEEGYAVGLQYAKEAPRPLTLDP